MFSKSPYYFLKNLYSVTTQVLYITKSNVGYSTSSAGGIWKMHNICTGESQK